MESVVPAFFIAIDDGSSPIVLYVSACRQTDD